MSLTPCSKWLHGIKCFQSGLKWQACFNLVMNGFWCWMWGWPTTHHVCKILGSCLDATCLPIDNFSNYRSKDKSSSAGQDEERLTCLSFKEESPQRQSRECLNLNRSTTNKIQPSLFNPTFIWLYGLTVVGPSWRATYLSNTPLECAKVHKYP